MPIPDRMMDELQTVLLADQTNQGQDEPIASALNLLQTDMDAFLKKYFLPVTGDTIPKGALQPHLALGGAASGQSLHPKGCASRRQVFRLSFAW